MIKLRVFLILAVSTYLLSACSSFKVEPHQDEDIFRNQVGTLSWGGHPAVDGVGMLFIVGDMEYGAPGTPEDYSQLFTDESYEVQVRADFKMTGKETVRGWGATFPEIEFIRIERI